MTLGRERLKTPPGQNILVGQTRVLHHLRCWMKMRTTSSRIEQNNNPRIIILTHFEAADHTELA